MAGLMFCIVWVPPVGADDEGGSMGNLHRGGALRLGAFWVFQIDTAIGVKSQQFPLGLHVDVTKDLGVTDSATVPRLMFTYRFNRRSQMELCISREAHMEPAVVAGVWPLRPIHRSGDL